MNKQVKKIILSIDSEYSLFGIHTTVPSYKLVYYLNKGLNITFRRDKDIDFIENNQMIHLNKYTYYDTYSEQNWTLASNQTRIKSSHSLSLEMFNDQSYTITYLIPEYKMFNYILKIDGELNKKKEQVVKMNNILIINIVSEINQSLIKDQDKLIF